MDRTRLRRWIPLALSCGLAVAPAARAELVILDDGENFKITDYALSVDGEKVTLDLFDGGRVTLSLERIERIVDDEWVPPPPPPPEAWGPPEPPVEAPVKRSWRFAPEHGVPAVPYGREIFAAAARHEVHPELVAAVVRAESAFQARARSHKGARGLMQLMPATGKRFGVAFRELYDPVKNIEAGTKYLDFLLERFDQDLAKVLAAYNSGEGTVDRYDGVPPYRETRAYVKRIFGYLGLDGATATTAAATTTVGR
jgi:hypothetical protein